MTVELAATMISGTVYLLLRHPAVLSEATRRVRADFPAETDLTCIKLQQHEYLNALLKEGLRLYPPAPDTLFRATTDESAIVAGQVVPPCTSLTMNLWAANRSQKNFHRPLEFVPERWMKDAPAEFSNDARGVLKPFSIGPRDCLGKKLVSFLFPLMLTSHSWKIMTTFQPRSGGNAIDHGVYSVELRSRRPGV